MSDHSDPDFNHDSGDEDNGNDSAIAIIGLSGRFPKAGNIDEFWANLRAGVECIEHYPEEVLLKAGVDPARLKEPNYVRAGALVPDADRFDAKFFEMTGPEAAITDPQHRLFLEASWEALEMAGYCRKDHDGMIGVYAGSSFSRYFFQCILNNRELMESFGPMQLMIGSDKDSLCTTVSYKLNLKGPAVSVQTACSTSLVAVHTACQAVLNGECDIALAGGVAIRSFSEEGYLHVDGDISSPDGHCRAFDAAASGTVSGNGLGVVVLKKLDQALADGDTVHAVIRGSAINNDGSQKVGYTAPSVDGQMAVIAEALAVSGVRPEDISYVETHGTGTVLGDPIELTALSHAYASDEARPGSCAIGAVKSNIGHLDAAAGVAGLIKVTLALKHREIPPTLHFSKPNPNFDLAASPFYINTALKEWTAGENGQVPRIAALSSFGIGGTNAHVVVQEAPAPAALAPSRWPATLLVSAKTPTAKLAALQRLKDFLVTHPDTSLADAAFTTQVGRESFEFREAVTCQSVQEAIELLDAQVRAQAGAGVHPKDARPARGRKAPSVVFMFPGQGTQYADMARSLYGSEPVFTAELDRCMDLFASIHGLDLRRAIFTSAAAPDDAAALLAEMRIAQPALFAVEYAMARFLLELGIEPAALVGHSIGEYVGACLAGVFSLEDAVMLVGHRGRLLGESPAGAMMVVHAPEEELRLMLGDGLWMAAINSPASCTVSGTPEAVAALRETCERQEIDTQTVRINRAGHSGLLREVAEEFRAHLARVSFAAPRFKLISNVSGLRLRAEEATSPQYWVDHLLKPVRFADCVRTLLQEEERIWVEVGPGKALSSLVRFNVAPDPARAILTSLPDYQMRDEPHLVLGRLFGELWSRGVAVRWDAVHGDERRCRIPLPTYPFERERHWVETSASGEQALALEPSANNGRMSDVSRWFHVPTWRRDEGSNAASDSAPLRQGPILMLGQASPERERMARALSALGARVLLVNRGDTLALGALDEFTIDPGDPGHYESLFDHLRQANLQPSALLHLWSLSPGASSAAVEDAIVEYHHLLGLGRALGTLENADGMALTVVADGGASILGNEALRPGQALVAAACRVIPLEYKNVDARYIDVQAGELLAPNGRLAGRIARDALSVRIARDAMDAATSGARLTAYRGAYRWLEDVRHMPLSSGSPKLSVRDEGVYLITGGLSGIGWLFAEHLARSARGVKLVLVSRGALPDRSQWEDMVAGGSESEKGASYTVRERVRGILALEKLGAQVLPVSADISVPDDAARVASAAQAFGPLSGIFHSAGVGDMALLHFRTRDFGDRVLAPKLLGTLQLEKNFAFEQLDFVYLCSSFNALRPTLGQADYCAANSFLDAYAHMRRERDGANVVSLNWGSWYETGMTRTENPEESAAGLGDASSALIGIKGEDAAPIFSLLGQLSAPQVVVSPYAFERVASFIASTNAGSMEAGATAAAGQPGPEADPSLAAAMNDTGAPVESRLLALWRHLFGSASLQADDNFFEIGGHSLLALQMASRIRNLFQVNLGLHNVFEAPTVALLARRIESAMSEKAQAQAQSQSRSRKEVMARLDGMSREELLQLLDEKKRAKAKAAQADASAAQGAQP